MLETLSQQLLRYDAINVAGLRGSGPALISSLAATGPCCCVLPDEHLIPLFEQDLRLFTDLRILVYPGYEIPPYTPLSPDQLTTATRLSTLYCLQENHEPFFLVTSIEALMRRVMPRKNLTGTAELVITGEECDQEHLVATLVHAGYEKVALVRGIGDFSVRGGIIDVFPPPFPIDRGFVQEGPIRLDFFGDTVDSIRIFDPLTQRSEKELAEVTLLPVSDILFPQDASPQQKRVLKTLRASAETYHWDPLQTNLIHDHIVSGRRFAGMEFFLPLFYSDPEAHCASVFDFLPQKTRLILVDPESCRQTIQLVTERITSNFLEAEKNSSPALPPSDLFLTEKQLHDLMRVHPQLL
jgi:transcription-repair coupling factor (superfamily II helicase)